MKIELVMSEFGAERQNSGGADLRVFHRLNPTLDSFRKVFPGATVTLYTDQDSATPDGVSLIRVESPFDSAHPRFGWRTHDYFQAKGLLESNADIAIAMDSDMLIVNDDFAAIAPLADRYGLAVPLNWRLLVGIDGSIGTDSSYEPNADELRGLGISYNLTPIAFSTHSPAARLLLQRYCELMLANPGRGGINLFRASFELGFAPYVLPPQWCVCSPKDLDSKHIWSRAVVLHVGHADVLPRWKREARRARFPAFLRPLVR